MYCVDAEMIMASHMLSIISGYRSNCENEERQTRHAQVNAHLSMYVFMFDAHVSFLKCPVFD